MEHEIEPEYKEITEQQNFDPGLADALQLIDRRRAMYSQTPQPTITQTKYIDQQNEELPDYEHVTYLPKLRPLLSPEMELELKFYDHFHGSVPRSVRDKIVLLAKSNYNLDIDQENLNRTVRLIDCMLYVRVVHVVIWIVVV